MASLQTEESSNQKSGRKWKGPSEAAKLRKLSKRTVSSRLTLVGEVIHLLLTWNSRKMAVKGHHLQCRLISNFSASVNHSQKLWRNRRKTKRQRQKADGISSKVVRAHDTPKVDLKSLQAKKKQKAAARHTWQHYLSQQAIIACRQCARRVDLSEEEATIIRVLERDFTISNCTKVLCKTCKS